MKLIFLLSFLAISTVALTSTTPKNIGEKNGTSIPTVERKIKRIEIAKHPRPNVYPSAPLKTKPTSPPQFKRTTVRNNRNGGRARRHVGEQFIPVRSTVAVRQAQRNNPADMQ